MLSIYMVELDLLDVEQDASEAVLKQVAKNTVEVNVGTLEWPSVSVFGAQHHMVLASQSTEQPRTKLS